MSLQKDQRIPSIFEGLHVSFQIVELTYSELHETCIRIPTEPPALLTALWRGWSFVDAVHRMREIAQVLPGLSQRCRERRAFLDETKSAKQLRDYIQHLRSELSRREQRTSPVWGTLSWVDAQDPMVCHTALVGVAQGERAAYSSCVFDLRERRWVSKITLGLGPVSFNFDPVHAACLRFYRFIDEWFRSHHGLQPQDLEQVPVVTIRPATAKPGDA